MKNKLGRPCCCRRVGFTPRVIYFKPRGAPLSTLKEISLTLDELEAVRLADYEGLYHEAAAQRMNISRPTFGRIIESARKKIASALIQGQALKIEGGIVQTLPMRIFRCSDCQHTWSVPYGTMRPMQCPACSSRNLHRAAEDRGCRHRGCRHMGRFRVINQADNMVEEKKGEEK